METFLKNIVPIFENSRLSFEYSGSATEIDYMINKFSSILKSRYGFVVEFFVFCRADPHFLAGVKIIFS